MSVDRNTFFEDKDDRKFQIFISSTFRDLIDERRMVLDAVIDRGHMPISLERFAAVDRTVPSVIHKTIEASQIYILLLGYRYGAIVEGKDISYCELEYKLAADQKKIIVPFVLIEDEVRNQRTELEKRLSEAESEIRPLSSTSRIYRILQRDIEELKSELSNESKLMEFRAKVAQGRFYKPFSLENNAIDYGSGSDRFDRHMVLKALLEAEKDAHCSRVTGWIREPADQKLSETLEAVSQNCFLVDVVASMAEFDKLGPRIRDHADEKKAAARFFAAKYLQPLLSRNTSLFFESGSSVAYVAQVVGKQLEDQHREITISTNNVLAYLVFWLVHRVKCSLFPWGPPEELYGAVFGPINEYVSENKQPCFPPEQLCDEDNIAISLLQEDPYSPFNWKQPAILLGALSGLQLSEDKCVSCCCGPHVGSPRNKVFKRFMYSTKLPIMFFLDESKIDSPVDPEHCHFILECDSDPVDLQTKNSEQLPWSTFISEWPVAFCIGCNNDESGINAMIAKFEKLGLDVLRANHRTTHTAVIARNQRFIDVVEQGMNLF